MLSGLDFMLKSMIHCVCTYVCTYSNDMDLKYVKVCMEIKFTWENLFHGANIWKG